jgi:hypothetical protein
MRIEILNAINEGIYLSLMIEVVALITAIVAVSGLAIYLSGLAWLCFEEKRRSITEPPTCLTRE